MDRLIFRITSRQFTFQPLLIHIENHQRERCDIRERERERGRKEERKVKNEFFHERALNSKFEVLIFFFLFFFSGSFNDES